MEIRHFVNKKCNRFSYAVLSNGEIALIDPSGDFDKYYEFAENFKASIISVIETDPRAEITESCKEIHKKTGAMIYKSKYSDDEFPHQTFDEGDAIVLGHISLKALNTPGFSKESICVETINEEGFTKVVFTGETLSKKGCGQPSEKNHDIVSRKELARQMYFSLRKKLLTLPENTIVYPSFIPEGIMIPENEFSTIGLEKTNNWSLQEMYEDEFVNRLINEQRIIQ